MYALIHEISQIRDWIENRLPNLAHCNFSTFLYSFMIFKFCLCWNRLIVTIRLMLIFGLKDPGSNYSKVNPNKIITLLIMPLCAWKVWWHRESFMRDADVSCVPVMRATVVFEQCFASTWSNASHPLDRRTTLVPPLLPSPSPVPPRNHAFWPITSKYNGTAQMVFFLSTDIALTLCKQCTSEER